MIAHLEKKFYATLHYLCVAYHLAFTFFTHDMSKEAGRTNGMGARHEDSGLRWMVATSKVISYNTACSYAGLHVDGTASSCRKGGLPNDLCGEDTANKQNYLMRERRTCIHYCTKEAL